MCRHLMYSHNFDFSLVYMWLYIMFSALYDFSLYMYGHHMYVTRSLLMYNHDGFLSIMYVWLWFVHNLFCTLHDFITAYIYGWPFVLI